MMSVSVIFLCMYGVLFLPLKGFLSRTNNMCESFGRDNRVYIE